MAHPDLIAGLTLDPNAQYTSRAECDAALAKLEKMAALGVS